MALRHVAGVACRNPRHNGATTAHAPAPIFASSRAWSRRLPWRSESTDWVSVWTMVPARPRIAAPARVRATERVTVKSAAPAMAARADPHSTERRPAARQIHAKHRPTTAAPAAQAAEYTPTTA
jgi:hypothetical protein